VAARDFYGVRPVIRPTRGAPGCKASSPRGQLYSDGARYLRGLNPDQIEEIRQNLSVVHDWLQAGEIEPLLELLLEPRAPPGVRIMVMTNMVDLDDQRLVPALVQLLADQSRAVRARAAQALGHCEIKGMDAEEAIPALLRTAEDDDDNVRMKSLIALSYLDEQRAIPAFLAMAKHPPLPGDRQTAVCALGRLRAPEAERYFIRYLTNPRKAAWAAGWLAEIGTDDSIVPLRCAACLYLFNRKDYRQAIETIKGRRQRAET
jgi:HEAT repeat protein